MRILVVGPGAVGVYFGGLLALAGHQVQFAGRERTSAHIAANGLHLVGPRGDFSIVDGVSATDDPAQALGADIVLSCVKLYDAAAAAHAWRPALESAGAVLSLQNGVDGLVRLHEGAPRARGFGGLAFVAGRIESPGVMHYLSDMSSLTFGGPGALEDPVLQAFTASINESRVAMPLRASLVDDIALAQWSKFLALVTNAALTCLTRSPAGAIYTDADLLALARRSIGEALSVGQADGVALEARHGDEALRMLQGLPADMVASMHHDLVAGKPLELEGLSGLVSRLGRRHGLATPFHDFAFACLKPHLHGAER